jgi:hypothetical protein
MPNLTERGRQRRIQEEQPATLGGSRSAIAPDRLQNDSLLDLRS